ncbi:MAG TPA: TlpA disulfide reductase family protein, partial [Chitinophagaceae bacterium]
MKKILLLHFISLLMLQLAAQTKTVNIQGIVKDSTVKSIEITYVADAQLSKWENTKLNVVNGAFKASLQIPFPVEITIIYGDKGSIKNYIDNDTKVLINTNGELDIIGSPMQEEYKNEFLPFFQLNDKAFDSLQSFYQRNYPKYGEDWPQSMQDSAKLLQEKYYSQRGQLLGEYIKRHPNSYVALWDIHYFVALSPVHRYFDFEKLFSSFSYPMQQQSFIPVLKEKVTASDKMQVGQLFPEEFFKGYEPIQSNIRKDNQYYLIDFWYSHCAPCAKGFPKLIEIYNQFHGKGFDIVSISVDKHEDKGDYLAAIKKHKLVWN